MRKQILIAAVAAAVVVGISGCSAGPASPVNTNATGAEKRGGHLTYLDAEIPISAQVQESGTWQDRALQQNITDRLIYRNPDTNELEPWIATSWTESPDGLTYTFVITDGVTYSDGTPLNTASVKRNLEWQVNGDPAKAISPNSVFPLSIAVTTDESAHTVTATLDAPYAPFLAALTGWSAGLVADSTIDASREDQSLYRNLIGSGPFVVGTEVYGKQIVLNRRAGYAWAPASSENQGEAYLDSVTITPVQEDSVRLGTLKSGQADLIRYVQPSEEKALSQAGFQVIAKSGVGMSNQWIVKPSAPFLSDVNVRKALEIGIDRQQLVADLYTSNWSAATSVLSPGTEGYKDESAALAYAPAQANTLLDQSGWTSKNADGYRTKDGQTLTVKTYLDVYDNTARALFQAIQVQLKGIGIKLDIGEIDYSSYWATAFSDPAAGVLRVGWPDPDPVGLLTNYGRDDSDVLGLKGSDATLNSLLDATVTTVTAEDRTKALAAAQDYLIDQAYVVPILNDSQVYVAGPTLQGFSLSDGALPQYYNAWLAH